MFSKFKGTIITPKRKLKSIFLRQFVGKSNCIIGTMKVENLELFKSPAYFTRPKNFRSSDRKWCFSCSLLLSLEILLWSNVASDELKNCDHTFVSWQKKTIKKFNFFLCLSGNNLQQLPEISLLKDHFWRYLTRQNINSFTFLFGGWASIEKLRNNKLK